MAVHFVTAVRARRLLLLACLAALLLAPAGASADVKAGQAALQKGDWKAAEAAFRSAPAAEAGAAALGLAETCLVTGRISEAVAHAKKAAESAPQKSEAQRLLGEAYRELGRLPEGKQALQAALQANPKNTRARVDLGWFLRDTGQQQAMAQTLQPFLDEYAQGAFQNAGAAALTDLGAAAHCLEMWQDANEIFRQATEKDPTYLRANVLWGDLFLEKYRPGEAQKSYEAVLKVNPHHPRARLGMARLQLTGKYDVRNATRLADEALAQNPRLVDAICLKAGLCLDNEEYERAEALLKQALGFNANHLQALTLMAASGYLQDDRSGYEARRAAVLKINPRDGNFYTDVSEYAVRHHRYQDAVELNRQAIALQPDNAVALVALGSGYLRLGDEAKGVEQLKKAWDLDPFNVMNYNLLTLFDEVVPKDYETVARGNFRFRMNKKEAPVLGVYVPDVMQRAWDQLCQRYQFTPKNPITVELFTERQHYSVRTTGLPDLGAQGTCFGVLITAMSPASGEANWEEVLWHELSHVFAIQLSNNRVSRWFTEGLSEYETNIVRPEWKREHNRELFLALRRGNLWSIGELSAAFTRPDRPNGVVIAYHQSSLVIHYLVETYGFEKILAALKLYAQGKRDEEVLSAISGKKMADLDAGFRAWLTKRLAPYAGAYFVDWQLYTDGEKWKKDAGEHPKDAAVQAGYAAALFVEKEYAGAKAQAQKAVALDAKNPLAHYVLAQVALEDEDLKAAQAELDTLRAAGIDSYGIRLALGQLAAKEGNAAAAVEHLNAAKRFDPDEGEPSMRLATLYREQKKEPEALKELEAYLALEEHDHDTALLVLQKLVAAKDQAGVLEYAPRLIAIQPMDAFAHEHYGRALSATGRHRDALREFTAALAATPRWPAAVRVAMARSYMALGDRTQARAAAQEALKEEPGNEEATALLKELG